MLLEHGADPEAKDHNNRTAEEALIQIATSGDPNLTEEQIDDIQKTCNEFEEARTSRANLARLLERR